MVTRSRYAGILSGIFLFFAITQTRKAHLRVTAILLLLRDKCRKPGRLIASFAEIFGQLLAVWISIYMVWTSVDHLFYLIKEGRKTESLYFLMWPFFLTFLVSISFSRYQFSLPTMERSTALNGFTRYNCHAERGRRLQGQYYNRVLTPTKIND